MNIADKIHLIDDLVEWVTENVEWAHKSTPSKFGPADKIEEAWEDVRLLAKKGLIAEKFIKEWRIK